METWDEYDDENAIDEFFAGNDIVGKNPAAHTYGAIYNARVLSRENLPAYLGEYVGSRETRGIKRISL
jgi:hypothetical protein